MAQIVDQDLNACQLVESAAGGESLRGDVRWLMGNVSRALGAVRYEDPFVAGALGERGVCE